jgi:serine protease Do
MATRRRNKLLILLAVLISLPAVACNLGGLLGGGTGAIDSLEDVKSATVQIVAQGTFIDPEVGMVVNAAGSGSGFIIDPSGIAVTNNHVVTGAAVLNVFVGGETEPRNARVLGVSECSDLAVVDIDGEGYPFFEWYDGDISVGMDVYAAGYPLGDPEFTLTRGIVSKESASGETPWSSVGRVIEHDATINPGSSGGPLVTPDGKVVAVNYLKSASDAFVAAQYFAIARDEAQPVIGVLRDGLDVYSLGINGEAINNGEGLSGVWVSSVKSGSPADSARLKAGDIVLSIEGLVLATDYTMSSYCDILRTHNPWDPMRLEVLRLNTSEFLEGQLNGQPLEVSFSFENSLGSQVTEGTGATYEAYANYVVVTDELNALQVEIPSEWVDVDGRPWVDNGEVIGAAISASADLTTFWDSWLGSGMYFYVTDEFDRLGGDVGLLDTYRAGYIDDCGDGGRREFENLNYRGQYDIFFGCGDSSGPLLVVLTAVPKEDPAAFIVFIGVQATREADLDALDQVLRSFQVIGALP